MRCSRRASALRLGGSLARRGRSGARPRVRCRRRRLVERDLKTEVFARRVSRQSGVLALKKLDAGGRQDGAAAILSAAQQDLIADDDSDVRVCAGAIHRRHETTLDPTHKTRDRQPRSCHGPLTPVRRGWSEGWWPGRRVLKFNRWETPDHQTATWQPPWLWHALRACAISPRPTTGLCIASATGGRPRRCGASWWTSSGPLSLAIRSRSQAPGGRSTASFGLRSAITIAARSRPHQSPR